MRKVIYVFLALFILNFFFTPQLYPLPPKGCSYCWSLFNNLMDQKILTFRLSGSNNYVTNLSKIRSALEKAGIEERVFVELRLNNNLTIKLGAWSPSIQRSGKILNRKFSGMGKVQFRLPAGLNQIPTSGKIIIKNSAGEIKSVNDISNYEAKPETTKSIKVFGNNFEREMDTIAASITLEFNGTNLGLMEMMELVKSSHEDLKTQRELKNAHSKVKNKVRKVKKKLGSTKADN